MPKVSYLIPVGRIDKYLEDALLSVDVDPYSDKSIVLVDNTLEKGDALELIIHRLKLRTNITVVRCGVPGVAPALNEGIKHVSSKYIARMDADDLVIPGRTSIQTEFLDRRPGLAGVGSSAQIIDMHSRQVGVMNMPKIRSLSRMKSILRIENPYIHPAMLLRTDILNKNRYSNSAVNCQDWDLWIRLSLDGHLLENVPDRLIRYRRHAGQISVNEDVDRNAHALRSSLLALDPSFSNKYLFQRKYLEDRRPSFSEILQVLSCELPKMRSGFAAKKLITALYRVIR